MAALAAEIVLIAPAEVADRADIDEADFELVGRVCLKCHGCNPQGRSHPHDVPFLHDLTPGHMWIALDAASLKSRLKIRDIRRTDDASISETWVRDASGWKSVDATRP